MNTQLTRDRRDPTVTIPVETSVVRRPRPPSLLDELALRIGLALIIWGRRRDVQPDRAELIRRHTLSIARERREREYQRTWYLVGPTR